MTQRVTNSGRLVRVAAALACAALLAGCSSTPDWANPVEWYKSAKSAVTGDDDSATEKAREDAKAKEKNSPDADKKYPNLATVPDRPKDISTASGEGTKVQQGLVADRTEARHAALGPGDNAMMTPVGDAGSSASSGPSSAPPPVIASPPPPPSRASAGQVEAPPVTPPKPPAPASRQMASQSQPEPQPQPAAEAPAGGGTPPSQQMASLEPAAPVIPTSSDSSDGVRRAFEEALSQQSAPMVGNATAGVRDMHTSAVPMETRHNTMPVPPESGSGITLRAPESAQTASINNTFSGAGASEVGTVFFANGSSKLSSQSVNELKNIADLYRQKGGKVRVVGHASSWTRNTDPLRHQLANFRVSLARANAVARQLTRFGVPADKIAVTAVADNEPVYYEFMPKGEAGNRRAEIFLDY